MTDDAIEQAMLELPREMFLPEPVKGMAALDAPVSIGYSQTNSQPSTVEAMLEWLDVQPGDSVLDVGSGSGWTTALLSHLTEKPGHVTAVEIVPELVEFDQANCNRVHIDNAEFHAATQELGWPQNGPYDRILVSASAADFPKELLNQLKTPGKMVIPVRDEIVVVEKTKKGTRLCHHPGYMFVPLM